MAAAPKRRNLLLQFEATGVVPAPMASIVPALIAIIRGAIKSPADVKRVLKSAPPAAVAAAAANPSVTPQMLEMIKSILSPPEMNANQPPAGSIGKIYYKGRQAGWAFGNKNAPKFHRKGQTNLEKNYNGWFLTPRGNSTNFNFDRKPDEDLKSEIVKNAPPDVALGLLAMITGLISTGKANTFATKPPPPSMPKMIGNLGARITDLIKSIVRPSNEGQAPPAAPPGVPNVNNLTPSVLNMIKKYLKSPSVPGAPVTDSMNITSKLLSLILAGIRSPKKSPSNNKGMANFILSPEFKGRMKGYAFTTRAGFFKNKGNGKTFNFRNVLGESNTNFVENKAGKTGYFLNKGEIRGGMPLGPPTKPSNRNYTKMTLKQLLEYYRIYPQNKDAIKSAIYKLFDEELKNARYESHAKRARRLGDLLRILPLNFSRRGDATVMVIEDIRNSRSMNNLSNIKSNLGRIPNENIKRIFEEQKRRFMTRKPNETQTEFERRRRAANENEMRRRRAVSVRPRGNMYPPIPRSNMYPPPPRGNMYPPPPRSNMMASAPPPLPPNQKQAINNAGGVSQALATVAAVPGGAHEVAKAAEALNETAGNVSQAVNIKGASPAAVAAVKKLGGANDAVNVLKGLNTIAQPRKVKTRARRSRSKSLKPRIVELNRVIEAVKKQKLISLIAHNITKTHNIHPNDERKKKYYKKVIKANILRRPFAKIVKRAAAKKNK